MRVRVGNVAHRRIQVVPYESHSFGDAFVGEDLRSPNGCYRHESAGKVLPPRVVAPGPRTRPY